MAERSAALFERAKKAMPSGVTSPVRYFEPYPFFVRRADGSHMWDADGKKITDMCCGYGALLLGHRRREIVRAVAAQLGRGTLYCAPTDAESELAEMIISRYPSVETVRLVNTGGEATMTAIRLARGYTGRSKVLKFEGCYHGAHDSVLVGAGSGAAHYGVPASAGVPKSVSRDTIVTGYNDAGAAERVIEGHADEIACVMVEPVMANMGLIPPKPGFLRRLRKVTRDNGILLVFDEVVTGFRVAPGGAQQHYNVSPDITTMAKAMSNGFGIAAVGGRRKIMQKLAPSGPVYQASTFAGNPLAVSAAVASLRVMDRLGSAMYAKLDRNSKHIADAVEDAASSCGIPHVTNRVGSMMQVFFTDQRKVGSSADALRCSREKFQILCRTMLKKGVFVAPSQFEVAFLSYAHDGRDVERVTDAYGAGLRAVRDNGRD